MLVSRKDRNLIYVSAWHAYIATLFCSQPDSSFCALYICHSSGLFFFFIYFFFLDWAAALPWHGGFFFVLIRRRPAGRLKAAKVREGSATIRRNPFLFFINQMVVIIDELLTGSRVRSTRSRCVKQPNAHLFFFFYHIIKRKKKNEKSYCEPDSKLPTALDAQKTLQHSVLQGGLGALSSLFGSRGRASGMSS